MAIAIANALLFPSPQIPSSDPNTLDDYVEGKWTPTLTALTTPPTGVTYTTQVGNHTKIGRLLVYTFRLKLSSVGSGGVGQVRVDGLPYVLPNAGGLSGSFQGYCYWQAVTMTSCNQLVISPAINTSQLALSKLRSSGLGAVPLDWADLTATSTLVGTVLGQSEATP